MADFNGLFKYNQFSNIQTVANTASCQTFYYAVEQRVLQGHAVQLPPSVRDFLLQVRTYNAVQFVFRPVKSFLLNCTGKDIDTELLSLYKSDVLFSDHKSLDNFTMNMLKNLKCSNMEELKATHENRMWNSGTTANILVYFLLKAFDRAFWLRDIKSKTKSSMICPFVHNPNDFKSEE